MTSVGLKDDVQNMMDSSTIAVEESQSTHTPLFLRNHSMLEFDSICHKNQKLEDFDIFGLLNKNIDENIKQNLAFEANLLIKKQFRRKIYSTKNRHFF